jgi:hypothetical protein
MGRKHRKAPSFNQEGVFFIRGEVDPVDMDCDLDDADRSAAMMKSLIIMMKHHGKS